MNDLEQAQERVRYCRRKVIEQSALTIRENTGRNQWLLGNAWSSYRQARENEATWLKFYTDENYRKECAESMDYQVDQWERLGGGWE